MSVKAALDEFQLPYYKVREVGDYSALSQHTGWGLNLLNIPDSWEKSTGSGITVMVIDTGNADHTDLSENHTSGPSFVRGEDGKDYTGHACVHGECLVYTKNYGIISIQDLFTKTDDSHVMVELAEEGNYRTKFLKDSTIGYEDNQFMKTNIELIHELPYCGELIVVEVEGRQKLRLTPWHPVYTTTGKKLARDLTIDDKFIVPDTTVELNPEYQTVDDGFLYKVCHNCGYQQGIRMVENKSNWQCKKCNKSKFSIERNITVLDEDLAYLVGIILSDGHILSGQDNQYRIEFFNTEPKLHDIVGEIMEKYIKANPIGRRCRIVREKMVDATDCHPSNGYARKDAWRTRVDQKSLWGLLSNLIPAGNKSKIVTLPTAISRSPVTVINAFLSGVIDGDGCISPNQCKNRITTASKTFAMELRTIMGSLGSKSRVAFCNEVCNVYFTDLVGGNAYINHPKKKQRLCHIRGRQHYQNWGGGEKSITTIVKEHFNGNLYDFTTTSGNYLADGLLVSNTHVCGIIAANNDSNGVVGIAPSSKVITVKALDKNGMSVGNSVTKALKYAVETKPDIVNMSLGSAQPLGREVQNLIQKLFDANIPVVCASGNSSNKTSVDYPANYPTTISVGAFDFKQNIAKFSNWGDALDFVAPGVDILSCWLKNGYARIDGTSMSAPFVAGILALVMSDRASKGLPKLTIPELKKELVEFCVDMGEPGKDKASGYGYIDVLSYLNRGSAVNQNRILTDLETSPVVGSKSREIGSFRRWWSRIWRK